MVPHLGTSVSGNIEASDLLLIELADQFLAESGSVSSELSHKAHESLSQAQFVDLGFLLLKARAFSQVTMALGLEPVGIGMVEVGIEDAGWGSNQAIPERETVSSDSAADHWLQVRPELAGTFADLWDQIWTSPHVDFAVLKACRRRIELLVSGSGSSTKVHENENARIGVRYTESFLMNSKEIPDDDALPALDVLGNAGFVALTVALAVFEAWERLVSFVGSDRRDSDHRLMTLATERRRQTDSTAI